MVAPAFWAFAPVDVGVKPAFCARFWATSVLEAATMSPEGMIEANWPPSPDDADEDAEAAGLALADATEATDWLEQPVRATGMMAAAAARIVKRRRFTLISDMAVLPICVVCMRDWLLRRTRCAAGSRGGQGMRTGTASG